jgi:hypothetical protein
MCAYATTAPTAPYWHIVTGTRVTREPEETSGTPRWAYATAIAVIVLAVAFVVIHLAGGGIVGH